MCAMHVWDAAYVMERPFRTEARTAALGHGCGM